MAQRKKNPHAVALGKARMAKLTPEQRSEIARNAVKARWAKTPKDKRSEAGRKAVEARWKKKG